MKNLKLDCAKQVIFLINKIYICRKNKYKCNIPIVRKIHTILYLMWIFNVVSEARSDWMNEFKQFWRRNSIKTYLATKSRVQRKSFGWGCFRMVFLNFPVTGNLVLMNIIGSSLLEPSLGFFFFTLSHMDLLNKKGFTTISNMFPRVYLS
jgi:hypothetical protein